MGGEKLEICFRFQTALTIGIISYCMCKNIGKRIRSLFCSIFIHIGLCQDLTIRRLDTSTYYPVRKCILTGVVRAVDKIFTFYGVKIDRYPIRLTKINIKKADTKVKGRFFFLRSLAISLSLRRCSLSSSFNRFFSLRFNLFVLIFPQNIQSLNDRKHQDGTHDRTASVTH